MTTTPTIRQIPTTAEWNPAFDDDPGFREFPNRLAPARTRTPAQSAAVPWCHDCEVHGHDTTTCPKRAQL